MELYLGKIFKSIIEKKLNKIKNNKILFCKAHHSININNLRKTYNIEAKKSNSKEQNQNYFVKVEKNYHCLILNSLNISILKYTPLTQYLKDCLDKIQYISLKDNHIRSLHFIKHLPNLYYLDISDNPLDEIDSLNYKNIFGYLKLSLERYSEKKILDIYGLYCGIFELKLNDESLLTLFKNNNPFICSFNNKINYFYDKVLADEEKDTRRKRRYSFKALQSKIEKNLIIGNENKNIIKTKKDIKKSVHKSEKELSNSKTGKNFENIDIAIEGREKKRRNSIKLKYTFINCYNYGFKSKNSQKKENIKKKGIENDIKNEDLLKIKYFFDEYNNIIINICNKCHTRGRKSKIPIKAKYLKKFKEYLLIEKRKLILLNDIYQKLSIFNEDKKENKFISINKEFINVNPNIDNLSLFILKDYIKCIYTDQNIAIIVLIVLLFYSLGIISNLMMDTIIGHLLKKYYKYIDIFKIPKIENENTNFNFLSYYFDNYENIKNKFIDTKDEKIKNIMNILEMTKIILKSNELYINKNKNQGKNFDINYINMEKYNEEINFLESLEIRDEISVLLIYLCDFIIYDNLEQLLINEAYPNEYSYLIGLFKEKIKEKKYNINEKEIALSERKYHQNQIERLYNKFYFKLYKIEEIKNSQFNHFKKYSIKILKNKKIKLDNDDEYNSTEDIQDINKYFVIQNKKINLNTNHQIFNNFRILNSFKNFSPTIKNFNTNYLKLKNNDIKIKVDKKINNTDNSNKIYSNYKQENINNINNIINSENASKCKDKTKLILKTLNNITLKNKTKSDFNSKLLFRNKNKKVNSDNFMFKTFTNDIKSKIKIKLNEKDFSIKGYFSNSNKKNKRNNISDIEYLYDLINMQQKKVNIRNNDKFNSLRNAERIYSNKKKDILLFTTNEINLNAKEKIEDNHNPKSKYKICNNSIPSLDIQKYNQKEMERILLNYKNQKYKKYNKKE